MVLPRASRAITRSGAVPRTATCSLDGITSSDTTRAATGDPTTTVTVAFRPSLAAVTTAVPTRPPVSTPVAETVTTAGSLVDHSMRRPLAALPRPSVATPVTCVDAPGASRTAGGVTSTDATVPLGAGTVTVVLALCPPLEAVRVAIPGPTARTIPSSATTAMDESLVVQVTRGSATTPPAALVARVLRGTRSPWPSVAGAPAISSAAIDSPAGPPDDEARDTSMYPATPIATSTAPATARTTGRLGDRPVAPAARRSFTVRSEERRVGEECRSRWSPDH